MEYIRIIFIGNLVRLRRERGLTQQEVAESLSITAPSYNKWEKGFTWPDPESIEKLASFYGVRSTALFHDPNVSLPTQDIQPPLNKKEIIKKLEDLIDSIKKH